MATEEFTVLYIGGYGRSGSTMLDRILGSMRGYVSLGEVYYLWERGVLGNAPCGCGSPFAECRFWQMVLSTAFPGCDSELPDFILRTRTLLEKRSRLPFLLGWREESKPLRERSRQYVEAHEAIYRSVADRGQGRVLVDSSKVPLFGLHLRKSPRLKIKFLHLIRDPRGVAYSRQRKKLQPGWGYMETARPIQVARRWAMANSIMEAGHQGPKSYLRIRYEDLVENPREILSRITQFCGAGHPEEVLRGHHSVAVNRCHQVAGNPNRFEKLIRMEPDLEWKEKMPGKDRLSVSMLTSPWLLRYGYPLGA